MSQTVNHPTPESIMEFAGLSKATLDREKFGDYFAMAVHFAECEKCRALKDDMVVFLKELDSCFSENAAQRALKLKVYCALEILERADEWKDNEILLSVKGKVSKQIGESVIQSINYDCKKEKNRQTDGEIQDKYNEIIDSDNNRISLGSEKVEVSLCDDGKAKHSVLIISEDVSKRPIFCDMQKVTDMWEVSCDCPADDYEIVVL